MCRHDQRYDILRFHDRARKPALTVPSADTLSAVVKSAALVLSLGLDTFAVAVGLGLSGLQRRDQLRFGASFALAEGLMPLLGFLVGQAAARAAGEVASYLAIAMLFGVGTYAIWESRDQEAEREYRDASPVTLLVVALSVSLDELAVGFSLGLLRLPVPLAAALIAAQAFVVTMVGIGFGRHIGRRFAERAGLLSGIALAGLALFLLAERVAGA